MAVSSITADPLPQQEAKSSGFLLSMSESIQVQGEKPIVA